VESKEAAAQVIVPPLVAGLDAAGLDREPRAGLRRIVAVQLHAALELVELPVHLGERLPYDEAGPRVGGVEDVVAGQLVECCRGGHAWSLPK
jgi:hypothetical protein